MTTAERPPDNVVICTIFRGETEPHPLEYGIVLGLETVEAGEKELEIGEEGLSRGFRAPGASAYD